jgi:hypothetical protein
MPHVVLVQVFAVADTRNTALLKDRHQVNRDKNRNHEKTGTTPQAHSVQLLPK